MTSTASTTSVASMTSTASFHQKTFNLKKKYIFLLVSYFLLLEKHPYKSKYWGKKMNQRCFPNWTIDGVQHWFNKNWLARQKCGFLRNTQDLLFKKKSKCISSPKLLFTVWDETPCSKLLPVWKLLIEWMYHMLNLKYLYSCTFIKSTVFKCVEHNLPLGLSKLNNCYDYHDIIRYKK